MATVAAGIASGSASGSNNNTPPQNIQEAMAAAGTIIPTQAMVDQFSNQTGSAAITAAQNAMQSPGGLASVMSPRNFAVQTLLENRGLGQNNISSSKTRANAAGRAASRAARRAARGGGADPNNVSASGFNPNTGNTTPTYNNLNSIQNSSANTTVGNVATDAMAGVGGASTPEVQTGSFSPEASIAAEGIFGSEESRGIQPYKKPLINF